jgi:hypothetical protein
LKIYAVVEFGPLAKRHVQFKEEPNGRVVSVGVEKAFIETVSKEIYRNRTN